MMRHFPWSILTLSLWSTSVGAQPETQTLKPLKTCTMDDTEWMQLIDVALQAYLSMDTEAFIAQRGKVFEHSICLSSVVTSETVGAFHRMEILYAFINKDKAAFAAHVRAAELADPTSSLATSGLVNDGHPILQWYSLAKEEKVATRIRLPIPDMGHAIFIDGAPAVGYPSDLPYIFQRVVNGVVEHSSIVPLDAPVPEYPIYQDMTLRIGLEPTMTWVSAGTVGLALTSAMLASRTEKKFWDPTTPNDALVGLQRRTNAYSSIGIVSGVLGVGALGMAYWEGTHAATVD